MSLMQQIIAPSTLNQAWRYFKNDRTHWQPGIPRREIEPNLYYHLLTLANDLTQGRYQPEPVRRGMLMRANKQPREIVALALRDKVAQRAVKQVLEARWEAQMHSDSFGYRPGRNTQMAWARAKTYVSEGYSWLVHTDIRHFFDEVPLTRLKKKLARDIREKPVQQLLIRWIDAHATTPAGTFRRARGLPQGGILSPLLGNWYLTELDNRLSQAQIRFVRYADDIMLCCATRQQARQQLDQLAQALKPLKLRLNPDKTRIVQSSKKVTYLGHPMPQVKAV